MTQTVFQRDDCQVTVRWGDDIAWIDWVDSKNAKSLDSLAQEVKEFLVSKGIKRVLTSVYAGDVDGERIYKRAEGFGFVPYSVCLQLVIDPSYQAES